MRLNLDYSSGRSLEERSGGIEFIRTFTGILKALLAVVLVQREISGPNINPDPFRVMHISGIIAYPVQYGGADFQTRESSGHYKAAEVNSRIVEIARARPYTRIGVELNGHRSHRVRLIFVSYGDDPSRSLYEGVSGSVAAFPTLLIRPILLPLIGVLAGQPQLCLSDEFQHNRQVSDICAPDVQEQLSTTHEADNLIRHVFGGRLNGLFVRFYPRCPIIGIGGSADVPQRAL